LNVLGDCGDQNESDRESESESESENGADCGGASTANSDQTSKIEIYAAEIATVNLVVFASATARVSVGAREYVADIRGRDGVVET
jgi:hypothetical protein